MIALEISIVCLLIICLIFIILGFFKKKDSKITNQDDLKDELINKFTEISNNLNNIIEVQNKNINTLINEKLDNIKSEINSLKESNHVYQIDLINQYNNSFKELLTSLSNNTKETTNSLKISLNEFKEETSNKLKEVNLSVNDNLKNIRNESNLKLEEIKNVVDEKLQTTLEKRLNDSFNNVINQISTINKTVGEIKGIATDVGSLKNVLTNVKTKGILGEIILGTLIRENLSVNQYEENFITKKGSHDPVEFAVKLPGVDDNFIYIPVDSKFPTENYQRILDAIDEGNKTNIDLYRKELRKNIKSFAKDISTKYIDVPNTTEFAIMFLPIEGLYAEVINMGLLEEVSREFHVNITGPSTFSAFLNALQMGFKTLAIQKKSADIFKLLGSIKTEFNKFGDVLKSAQKRVNQVSDDLDTLVGVRTRQIQSKLKSVDILPDEEANDLLEE